MAGRRAPAPPSLQAVVALVVLVCCAGLAAAQRQTRPRHPARSLADLVCDGKLRTLNMATSPFPTGPPWTPLTPAGDFTCTRPLAGASLSCGSQASEVCDQVVFSPVLQSSGVTPGIIPPNNPLRFQVKANSDAFLTFVEFTGGDIGTGGARLRALYGVGSTLDPSTFDYQWTVNGPQDVGNQQGMAAVFGPCTDCRSGFGIKNMSLAALPGTGFRAVELSQLYGDTRCGGAGVNNDGMLWTGMAYSCAVPTCADIDLNEEGKQAFAGCTGDLIYNPVSAGRSPPSIENCCTLVEQNPRCDSISPPDGPPFPCPDGYQYNPAGDGELPSVDSCCLKQTCGNVEPATNPGTKFDCGEGYEYNPSAGNTFPPSVTRCCLKRTCGNYQPATKPSTPFQCTGDTFYNPAADDFTPPSQSTCCLEPTCAMPDPAEPGQAFQCSPGTEFTPEQAGTSPPSQQACCTPGTCATPFPFSSPTESWDCPPYAEYNPANANQSPPSDNVCCLPGTCGNVAPVTTPGTPFTCPGRYSPKPDTANATPPTRDNCCERNEAPPPTCGDTNPGVVPPVPFNCSAVQANLTFNPDNVDEWPPSVISCCNFVITDSAGVYVVKTVDDAIDANGKVSQLQPVGYEFTFRLKVGVESMPSLFATDVVLTDMLPKGLTLAKLVEGTRQQPRTAPKACSYTPRGFRCTWAQLAWNEEKVISIVARAIGAGNHTNYANVTTTSQDPNLANNKDFATVRVAPITGACCDLRTGECVDGRTEDQCGSEMYVNFRPNGACGQDGFCSGSCCLQGSTGECRDSVPKKECAAPGTWVLYGQCGIDCPGESCTPAWNSCDPNAADPCCDGHSCQPTYKHCVVGPYVCKPKDKPCSSKAGLCGGHFGACCKGYTCSWSHHKGIGKCTASNTGCQWDGGSCHKDWDCCPGAVCKHGKCKELSSSSCKKECSSYECYAQRKQECDVFLAAAASEAESA